MSNLTAEQWDILQPVISGVAITLKRRYPMLTREDIEQEGWVWVLEHPKQVQELFALEDEKERDKLFAFRISRAARVVCEQEKANATGYSPDDVYFYGRKELEVLVSVMFDQDSWLKAPESDEDSRRNAGDPAVGGNWVALLADVSRAYSALGEEDQAVLELHLRDGMTQKEIGEEWNLDRSTISYRLDRAIGRLHELLGGDRPSWDEPDPEYTGQRKHRTNAAALFEIRNQY